MKHAAYCLIFLLLWAQVDDAWVPAPTAPSSPIADDDEYLPAQRQSEVARSPSRRRALVAVRNLVNGDFSSPVFRKTPFASPSAVPFHRSSLYVFMSLRW